MKILVLDVPGLHAGYLGCYGNDWIATPNFDRLAAQGIVGDRHYVDRLDGLGAFTGRYFLPEQDQPEPAGMFAALLVDLLMESGIPLHAFHVDAWKNLLPRTLSAVKGLPARGLAWVECPSLAPPWKLPADLLDSYCDEDEDSLPEPPCQISSDDDLFRAQNTYAAVVTFVDAQLGRLLEKLDDDVLLCVTAMCGLSLGEHEIVGSGWNRLHEEVAHLPLIARFPGHVHAGLRLGALTQPVDLLPTFLDLWKLPANDLHGRTLMPLLEGTATELRPCAVSFGRVADCLEWAVRTPDWTLLGNDRGEVQLFAQPEDRWEVNDLKQPQPEEAETLARLWPALVTAMCQPGPMAWPAVHV